MAAPLAHRGVILAVNRQGAFLDERDRRLLPEGAELSGEALRPGERAVKHGKSGKARFSDLDMALDRLDALDRQLVEGDLGSERFGLVRQHFGIFVIARMRRAMDALRIIGADESRRAIFDRWENVRASGARPHSARPQNKHGAEAAKK